MTHRAALAAAAVCALSGVGAQAPPDLTGLWTATHRFGPDIAGTLIIRRGLDGWHADIAGFQVPVRRDGAALTWELPNDKGSFRGRVIGQAIHGHWIQPASRTSGLRYATPTLAPQSGGDWRGMVTPLESRLTFYLPLMRQPDASYRTYLRNPERNLGRFLPVTRLQVNRDEVSLIGMRGPSEATLAAGRYANGALTVPLLGTTYDFTKASDAASSPFFPRGKPAPRYRYMPPLPRDDGWPVASVEDVGISREGIERFVQMLIEMPMDSVTTPQIHSVLIARHGKLVVEEYFHGYHRDLPHDTRSAAKSWVAVLIGAASLAGIRTS